MLANMNSSRISSRGLPLSYARIHTGRFVRCTETGRIKAWAARKHSREKTKGAN